MATRPAILPDYVTPADLALHLGISERTVRDIARQLGAYRIIGKTMFLLEGDIKAIFEASKPCPTKSTNAAKSGISGAQLPVGDFAALAALRTKKLPKESLPKPKQKSGTVISMGQVRT